MEQSVIVLGAKGRLGRATLDAFKNRGWRVTAFARRWEQADKVANVRYLNGSALDEETLMHACAGHDVIVNALNPQYEDWEELLPTITKNVISAGIASGATVMIPGNIYNYGNELPAVISEETPQAPNTKKGRLRIEMEQAYKNASKYNLKTIVLRSGDFFEGKDTGNWFETYIANKIERGIICYPGPMNSIHSWAFLPDMARAMAELAECRQKMNDFEELGFRGYAITGDELVRALEHATNRELRTKKFPWSVVRLMALFSKPIHEILEMRYLWQRPHAIDDQKLRKILPNFHVTPLQMAMDMAIGRSPVSKEDEADEGSPEPVNN